MACHEVRCQTSHHLFPLKRWQYLIFPNKDIGFRIPLIKELSRRTNSEIILVAYRGYSDSEGFPS